MKVYIAIYSNGKVEAYRYESGAKWELVCNHYDNRPIKIIETEVIDRDIDDDEINRWNHEDIDFEKYIQRKR